MEMETLIPELSRLLSDSLSSEKALITSATDGLDRLSGHPYFPLSLLSIATGGGDLGVRMAAAAYLKNFTRRHSEETLSSAELHVQFRNQLAQALLQAEYAVLKVLVETFRMIIDNDFVKKNSWPDLVPELKSAIESSNLISQSANSQWNTINALTILQTVIRPFQYFLNPKIPKESVPSQLELIASDILVPLLETFHHFVHKVLSHRDRILEEFEQILLIICKCMYFTVRSYMPSALGPLLPSFCGDLFLILDSLSLTGASAEDGYLLRLKTAKRSLIIFCALLTRHRKHADKLMSNIISCAFKITKQIADIDNFNSLSERVASLAFDVISHVLETGPGWRLVSPHFSSLLDSAIFPALTLNQKDISEWEEDSDEYMRKNLPSDLGEISGWAEDLFTARKSAINLLGVIAMSKGPPVISAASKRKKGDKSKGREHQSSIGELLVIPFLSKFPVPSDGADASSRIVKDYFGVLMAYGGLQDFLKERSSGYTSTLVSNRVLPLYSSCLCSPYLVSTANWVLGELAFCLPQVMSADIYSSLMKALNMPEVGAVNFYPVRASAAGAIGKLIDNDYIPPDWISLLQVLVNRMSSGDENECSLLFQLLGTVVEGGKEKIVVHIPVTVSYIAGVILNNLPSLPEPWPQVVEHGFATLAVLAQTWEDSMPDDVHQQENWEWRSGWTSIARAFSNLLQQSWLTPPKLMEAALSSTLPPPSCLDDASTLLGFVMRSVTSMDEAAAFKIMELLAVWADLIADWHAWEEMEDLKIFSSIQEAINLHRRCDFINLFIRRMSSHDLSPGSAKCIIEDISAFVSEAITAYPSALWRACSCVHALLHVPRFSFETEPIKQSMAVAFAQAAFSRFGDIHNKPQGLWKPLLLIISSCYISYPENIEQVLEKGKDNGFMIFACGLAYVSASSFEPGLSSESEIKLAVIALTKVVERLLQSPTDRDNKVLHDCFVSLMEACIRLKEVQEEDDNEDSDEQTDDDEDEEDEDEDEDDDDDDDSEDDECEETEEEFLDRYAQAAAEFQDEGDAEDDAQDLELGALDEVDIQNTLVSLIERHKELLLKGKALPPSLLQGIVEAFPNFGGFFQIV